MSTKRITTVTNTTGSTVTFREKRFSPGEAFEIIDSNIDLWRDDLTVSGAINSGTLLVSNDTGDFVNTSDGLTYFYDTAHINTITISGVTVTGALVIQGTGGVILTSTPSGIVTVSGFRDEFLAASGVVPDIVGEEIVTSSGFIQTQVILNRLTAAGGFITVDEALSTTTSTTFQQKATLDADITTIVTGTTDQFRLLWYYEWGYSSAAAEFNSQVVVDDVDIISNINWRPAATSADTFAASSGFIDMTLSSGTHFFDLDFRSTSNGKTARIQRARLSLSRVGLFEGVNAPPQRGT